MSLALEWAKSLQSVGVDRATDAGLAMARACIIDTIGVTLAGSREPTTELLCSHDVSSHGQTTLIGRSEKRSMLDAAMTNGAAAHAIDYDDMAESMGGHPSVPMLPAVLALGEHLKADGRAILDAYIVGFEAECRMGLAVHPHHYNNGWHPTSTLGVFGAAAASSRLLDLNADQFATAFALSSSMAAGLKANFGSMTKPFHAGNAARSGLLSALLVRDGFTANTGAIDGKQGFFAAFDGLENVQPEMLTTPSEAPLEIERLTVGLKQFPCCGSTHPAILAALKLREGEGLEPDQIESLEIRIHPARIPHTNNPMPDSALASKFSQQYAVARTLITGAPRLRDFEGDSFRDNRIQDLLKKIQLVGMPGEGRGMIDNFAAEIDVRMTNGMMHEVRVDGILGRGPQNPMSDEELWEKFSDCGDGVLPDEQLKRSFELVVDLENLTNVRDLLGCLSAMPHDKKVS